MTLEERLEVYRQATELWGLVAQYDQCVEEMGELIVAINKFKRKVLYKEYKGDSSIIENLVEEIADVSICMEQMRDFYKDYGARFYADYRNHCAYGVRNEMEQLYGYSLLRGQPKHKPLDDTVRRTRYAFRIANFAR